MIEERIKEIQRQIMSEEIQQQQLRVLTQHEKKQKQLQTWSYRLVFTSLIAILLFFVVTLQQTQPSSIQTAPFEKMEQVTVLFNEKPERKLNLNSWMYVEKRESTAEDKLAVVEGILSSVAPVQWTNNLNEYDVGFDILVHYTSGEEQLFKFLFKEDYELVNVASNEVYVLSSDAGVQLYKLLYGIEQKSLNLKGKLAVAGALVLLLIAFHFKKSKESRKGYRNPLYISILASLPMCVAIFSIPYVIGSMHIGVMSVAMALSMFIREYDAVKREYIEANWKAFCIETVILCLLLMAIFI